MTAEELVAALDPDVAATIERAIRDVPVLMLLERVQDNLERMMRLIEDGAIDRAALLRASAELAELGRRLEHELTQGNFDG
jgi:hypothetical protein